MSRRRSAGPLEAAAQEPADGGRRRGGQRVESTSVVRGREDVGTGVRLEEPSPASIS